MLPSLTHIKNLSLRNFRNFDKLNLEFADNNIVFIGQNGVGKTNILEAISLLAPGRGLRNAKLEEMVNLDATQDNICSIDANITFDDDERNIMIVKQSDNKRKISLDGKTINNQTNLAQIIDVIWLTPLMDSLFIGSAAERRKFLDQTQHISSPIT